MEVQDPTNGLALGRFAASVRIDLVTRTWSLLGLAYLCALCAGCGSTVAREGGAAEIHRLTGTHTRAVWVQGDGTDPYASGDQLVLMGLDSDDGRAERAILSAKGSYVKPMLTSDGRRVVFSTSPGLGDASVHIVNFDGSGLEQFGPGFALAVWQDPADGGDWIYIGTDHRNNAFSTITRVRIDQRSRREQVWNGAPVTYDTFQVSRDGQMAGGLFPWPAAGIANLARGSWQQLGEGCWTALNDVGVPLFWYFDGAHRNLSLVDVNRDRRWTVPINQAPEFDNPEVYHPRWSHHPRFMTMSGPYNQGGTNQVRTGGKQAEIWLGRFSDDFTRIEDWARVTHNTAGDSYPDIWIDLASSEYPQRASGRVGPAVQAEGPRTDRIVLDARLATAGIVPEPASIAPYRHALVVNTYDVVKVVEGQATTHQLLVAEWAIRDARVLEHTRTVGEVRRLTVERYDAHPELEGERLIQGPSAARALLYYAIPSAPAAAR
jgi:hypothetical protein